MTVIVCTALVCVAFVVCYWLHLRFEEAHGKATRRLVEAEEDVRAWRNRLDAVRAELDELASRVKRLDVLENKRQLGGR